MSAATSEIAIAEVIKADALAPAFDGLESSSARQLREAFVPALIQIEEWERQAADLSVTDESQTAKMKMAGVMRKELKRVRISVEKKRKELNADALARTKAINCAAGIVEGLIVPLEKRLHEAETFAERAETARKDALRSARIEALVALGADPTVYANLGETSEETWAITLEAAKDAKTAREEAAKQAEAVRLEAERLAAEARAKEKAERARVEAERVERERMAAEENARLAKEKAEIEAAAKADRERAEAEAASVERARAAERDAANLAAESARLEKEREVAAARAETDKAARALARAQAEAAQAKADAEKATAEREAAELAARQAAALAPDREKLAAFAALLRALEIPTLSTPPGKAAATKVAEQIAKMAAWVEKTGASL
jgi:hypothetical protein